LEPELGARVLYRGRSGTITQKQLAVAAKRPGDLSPSGRRYVVVFLDPGLDGRGEEVTLFESDWDELEPVERSDG
jgi:hypothetical protein